MAKNSKQSGPGKAKRGKKAGKKAKKTRSGAEFRLIPFVFKWSATLAIWGAVITTGVTAYFAYDLPSVDDALAATRQPAVTVHDRNDRKIASFGELHGAAVQVNDLPAYLPQAVIATEDRRFYDHKGVDLIGVARAIYVNLKAGRIVQGGSTITQQAAKNLFLSPERSLKRKVQEVLLAFWLEYKFSKDQILTIYLNRVYLGAGTYGVAAAARKFYARSAKRLTLYQSAVIAGLLKAPSRLNPARNPKGASARANVVLANMVAAGYLTTKQAKSARRISSRAAARPTQNRLGRYFADWILGQLPGYVGRPGTDIVIKTTLDAGLQKSAETVIKQAIAKHGRAARFAQAALVTLSPDGAVRAMVGGGDYRISQFNRATQAKRQPGSAFKPFVYLAALEAGLTPASTMTDRPIAIGSWRPKNYDGKFHGEITLRDALAASSNSIAVQLAERAGRRKLVGVAKRLGITSSLKPDPSLALGTAEVSLLELTGAYAPFANGGQGIWAYGIREITDDRGRVLFRRQGSGPGPVISRQHLAQMNSMMSGVISRGTGRAAQLDRPAAGKTGTSQEFRDAWFVGYTADYVSGVWIGNDNGASMKSVTGGGLPARLWRSHMAAGHRGLPARALPGLTSAPAQRLSSKEKSFWDRLVDQITGAGG